MDNCVWKECRPILLRYDKELNRVAFDGFFYYFTVLGAKEIIKTDSSFNIIECICTSREYDCICFNSADKCFLASCAGQFNVIYKLNSNMTEIDCISFEDFKAEGCITGVSFNCCRNSIIVSYNTCIVEVNKCFGSVTVLYRASGMCINGVLSLCPVYIVIAVKNCQSHIYILDENGKVIDSCCADCRFMLNDIIFDPCQTECGKIIIDFFAVDKDKCPNLCRWILPVCELNITICPCNFAFDKKHCNDNCGGGDVCADILESIALVEASLAHILNAEGEKLQKVLSITDDLDEILCVNREINRTIINATHLEHTLYAKLTALCECGLCGKDSSTCFSLCKRE